MAQFLRALGFSLIILILSANAWGNQSGTANLQLSPLQDRQHTWPNWTVPGPLRRPKGGEDLVFPTWMEGLWAVENHDLQNPGEKSIRHLARFHRNAQNQVVGDREFNATSIGRAAFGDQLLRIETKPESPNQQLTFLKGNYTLETRVVGRLEESIHDEIFLADELVLQIMHGPSIPRISRIETLSLFRECEEGSNFMVDLNRDASTICADQWQAKYSGPGEKGENSPEQINHYFLVLRPLNE